MAGRDSRLERLLFLSDGVYAIALTLLAVELVLPESAVDLHGRDLLESLLGSWPKVLAFLTSFTITANDTPPDEVFAWLSEVGNLPKYLPPVVDSSVQGPSAQGSPGQKIRTTVEYPGGEDGAEPSIEDNPAVVDEDPPENRWPPATAGIGRPVDSRARDKYCIMSVIAS